MTYTYDDIVTITGLPPVYLIKRGGIWKELQGLGLDPVPWGSTGGATGSKGRHELLPKEMLALSVVIGLKDMTKECRRVVARRILTGIIGRYIIVLNGEYCICAQTLGHMLEVVQSRSANGDVVAIVDLVRMAQSDEGREIVERAIAETRCA